MRSRELRKYAAPASAGEALLRTAIHELGLSARAYDRVRKVARTFADLEGAEGIGTAHLAEALPYRSMELKS